MNNIAQTIQERIQEAVEEDTILRDRIHVEKIMSQLFNYPELPLVVERAEAAKQEDENVGIKEQKEYYGYELRYVLYCHALQKSMLEKKPQINIKLEKWREKIPYRYEFYGVLAHYHTNLTRNIIDYFIMSGNPNFVNAIFEYYTRNTLPGLYHHISLKPCRTKGESRPPSDELCNFVDGILMVRSPAFTHAGEASNNKDALDKAERLKNLFKKHPFSKSDVGERLLRYEGLINKPKDLFPGVEEYVKLAEYVLQNYCDIKQRTNSTCVSFDENRFEPVMHFFTDLEIRYLRKHDSSGEIPYTA
jgi:hypothetical protein